MKKSKLILFSRILILLMPFSVSCKKEPDRVTVQHVLIAFQGSIPDESITRTREEARKIALEVFDRARKGEDFDDLVRDFTDDQYPGIYSMSNFDVSSRAGSGEFPRSRMVKAFGDVSFQLAVGEVGMADYDPEASKYGWHIIKRIE